LERSKTIAPVCLPEMPGARRARSRRLFKVAVAGAATASATKAAVRTTSARLQ
jgi:hypothetical protein